MIRLKEKMSEEQLTAYRNLAKSVPFKEAIGSRCRVGCNKLQSKYTYSKWLTWNRQKRAEFKNNHPTNLMGKALVGWFLKIGSVNGFLDKITTWEGQSQAGYLISYNIGEKKAIVIIDDVPVEVDPGCGIAFCISKSHEIKRSADGALWANIMLQGIPSDHQV